MGLKIRTALLLLGAIALLAGANSRPAKAQGCPPGTVKIGEQQNTLPDGTTEIVSTCQQRAAGRPAASHAVPNLAEDPNAARLSAAQLKTVDARIAFLRKEIELLGEANPEWAREREWVSDDMHEAAAGAAWEGVNLLSLGLAELTKILSKARFSALQTKALRESLQKPLRYLPEEEARLKGILETTKDPEVAKAISHYLDTLHRLGDAQRSKGAADMIARARDAADALSSHFELMKGKSPGAADELYMSSAFMGSVAIVFIAEGPEAIAASAGSAGSSVLVGGRALMNYWEERRQMQRLDQNASDRNSLRMELMGRLNELQDRRDSLALAVQRAGGDGPK